MKKRKKIRKKKNNEERRNGVQVCIYRRHKVIKKTGQCSFLRCVEMAKFQRVLYTV